jgi:hypothetical protein
LEAAWSEAILWSFFGGWRAAMQAARPGKTKILREKSLRSQPLQAKVICGAVPPKPAPGMVAGLKHHRSKG